MKYFYDFSSIFYKKLMTALADDQLNTAPRKNYGIVGSLRYFHSGENQTAMNAAKNYII